MTTYRIRGWIGGEPLPSRIGETTTDASFSLNSSLEDVWVELWDKDERFDDRLGRGKTNSNGIFEIDFTDEYFRQDIREHEWHPDLFVRVYRGKELLFDTATVSKIAWNFYQWQDWETKPPQNPDFEGTVVDGVVNFNFHYPKDIMNDGIITVDEFQYMIGILNSWKMPEPIAPPMIPSEILEPEEDLKIRRGVVDILPRLDQVARSRSGASGTLTTGAESRGGSLQQLVDNALGSVLCRHPNSDPQVFLDSLEKAFTPHQEDNRTIYLWNPCSYGARIETDLGGAITGAQASLFNRAKTSLGDALKLLDHIHPLNPAADPQNMEATRSTVRTEIIELLNELGLPEGPREQRVDSLFQVLIGDTTVNDSYEVVGGQMQQLADAFGLERSLINTVSEEHNYSNYLTMRDYLISLRDSWTQYSSDSGAGAYIGTQLVLLSQALSVIAQSVEETYRIMDLYFLGPAERRSVWIDFTKARDRNLPKGYKDIIAFVLPDGTGYLLEDVAQLTPPMTVEELLSWALRFATQEGPALAMSGGKIGIASSLAETAKRLMILSTAAAYTPVKNTAYKRSAGALLDLGSQCYEVQRLAQEVIPPITSDRTFDAFDIKDESRRSSKNGKGGQPVDLRTLIIGLLGMGNEPLTGFLQGLGVPIKDIEPLVSNKNVDQIIWAIRNQR